MVQQLESGTKLISLVKQPSFVFASLWPSWFFAARSAGYESLVVCVEDAKLGVDKAIKAVMTPEDRWMEWNGWKQALRKQLGDLKDEQLLVMVQGPRDALNRVLEFLSTLSERERRHVDILAIATSEATGRRRARKRQKLMRDAEICPVATLSHRCVGGVVDKAWTIESNIRHLWSSHFQLEKESKVKASLQDYLSRTEGGKLISSLDPRSIQPTHTIDWKKRNVQVIAESVFSKTGWVRRKLTINELMDAYDVGVGDRQVMQHTAATAGIDQFPLEFTQQIPVRVLLRCLEVVRNVEEESKKKEVKEGEKIDESVGDLQINWETMLRAKKWYNHNEARHRLGASDEEKRQAKNDDAVAAVVNWNRRVCERLGVNYEEATHAPALDKLRDLQLRWYRSYKSGIIGSFRRYMHMEHGKDWLWRVQHGQKARDKAQSGKEEDLIRDYEVGMDAISRALAASFWEWDDGSTVFFWRWTKEHRRELRDGLRVWVRKSSLPRYWGRQRWPEVRDERDKLKGKIQKIVDRRYISSGFVRSLTSFFAVPKGIDDIRVVYDATKSGLNDAIWAPNFFLPTMSSVLNNADDTTFYGDIDIGEMFLNYFLDPEIRPWAGVDVTELSPAISQKCNADDQKRTILRWDRSLMGVRSSPFNCVRAYLISEEIIKGNRLAPSNPFKWHRVVYNLPGQSGYDPSKPWIYRYDDDGQVLAAFVSSYVDDLRTGSSKGRVECERVTHVTGSKLNYLGEQDATRKRGEASQEPGAWAGSVIVSRPGEGLYVTISQEKWNKVRSILSRYCDAIRVPGETRVDYRQLEKDTGFLVHVFMTYEQLRLYLKGFYLTLNEWRYNRDPEGWAYQKKDWEELAEECWGDGSRWEEVLDNRRNEQGKAAPTKVRVVPRLVEDVQVLEAMFQEPTPSLRLVRGGNIVKVVYGFGDASGAGFGSSWVDCDVGENSSNRRVHYRFGRWGSDTDGKSSNFRELRNLVSTLEQMALAGELKGVEMFLFTDNSTAEAAFQRGSSSSKLLYELVKKLKVMEMLFLTRIHIIHVAGKRMIQQGTDGLSRGCLTDGVMIGREMSTFVPLHRHALERSNGLLTWLQEAIGRDTDSVLDPLRAEDWYEKGHDIAGGGSTNCDGVWTPTYRYGNFVWSPPPCVAEQCMEELRKARHKRQRSTHIFVCPRIMSYTWQRHLFRSADVVFQLPAGHPAWSEDQHEPLVIGLFFPFLRHEPWQLKDTDTILGMARHLQRMCKDDPGTSGLVLRELWQFTRKLANLPERVVCRLLQRVGDTKISKTIA